MRQVRAGDMARGERDRRAHDALQQPHASIGEPGRVDPRPHHVERARRPMHLEDTHRGICPAPMSRPSARQQQRGVEMVGVTVPHENRAHGVEAEARPRAGRGHVGRRVEQNGAVDENPAAPAHDAMRTGVVARRAAAEGLGPAVRGTRAEQGDPHRASTNTTGAPNAARRVARRRAPRIGAPATRISVAVSTARGMS